MDGAGGPEGEQGWHLSSAAGRTSVRGKRLDAQSNDHNLISFQDKAVTDLAGKEVKRWT